MHHIGFDKVLYLNDTSEENAGAAVKTRMTEQDMHYDWDAEFEKATKIKTTIEEKLNPPDESGN